MGEFRHKHSLGQNFLKDKNVLMQIIDSVDVKENDLILEVGPGQGALTKYLKLFKANLRCFEIDTRVKKYLNSFLDDKTDVIYKDFMQVNLQEEIEDIIYQDLYVIANLPYYITTPIIEKVLSSNLDVQAMVLMVQNEVADRLSAKPGTKDYGAISVLLGYTYQIEMLIFVSRSYFEPVPNVDSAVIKLTKRELIKEADNKELFEKLVRDAFMMKRKNLRNNLNKYDLEVIEPILTSYGLTLQDRAEKVTLACFIDIANALS